MYSVEMGQYIEVINNRLEAEIDLQNTDKNSDVINLPNIRKIVPYDYEYKSYPFLVAHQAIKAFHLSYHRKTMYCSS